MKQSLHDPLAISVRRAEARAGSLDQAVLEGASAIAAALVDLGRIAMDFITSAVQSLSSSVAAGPAGFAMASTTIAASGEGLRVAVAQGPQHAQRIAAFEFFEELVDGGVFLGAHERFSTP